MGLNHRSCLAVRRHSYIPVLRSRRDDENLHTLSPKQNQLLTSSKALQNKTARTPPAVPVFWRTPPDTSWLMMADPSRRWLSHAARGPLSPFSVGASWRRPTPTDSGRLRMSRAPLMTFLFGPTGAVASRTMSIESDLGQRRPTEAGASRHSPRQGDPGCLGISGPRLWGSDCG